MSREADGRRLNVGAPRNPCIRRDSKLHHISLESSASGIPLDMMPQVCFRRVMMWTDSAKRLKLPRTCSLNATSCLVDEVNVLDTEVRLSDLSPVPSLFTSLCFCICQDGSQFSCVLVALLIICWCQKNVCIMAEGPHRAACHTATASQFFLQWVRFSGRSSRKARLAHTPRPDVHHIDAHIFSHAHRPLPVHPKLQSQIRIATCLENPAQPERPGDEFLAQEEIAHLHGVSRQPIDYDREAKALARACAVVLEDLRYG